MSILIIDDDEMSRDLLALLLGAEGHTVHTLASGDAALLHLQSHPAPQVVLTDMQMPGIAGSALATALRTVAPAARLIAMSGSQPPAQEVAAFDALLLKPFTTSDFAAALAASTQSQPVSGDSNTLSEQTFASLAAAMPQPQLQQLYAICLDDARKRITRMQAASAADDDPLYRREAHAIKGSCGMLGASHLQALAGLMETSGLPKSGPAPQLAEFVKACDDLERILKARFALSSPLDSNAVGEA